MNDHSRRGKGVNQLRSPDVRNKLSLGSFGQAGNEMATRFLEMNKW
jgi:hypothetical protein